MKQLNNIAKTAPLSAVSLLLGATLCSCAAGGGLMAIRGGIDGDYSPALYPAKVQSMTFDGNNVLDATHSVSWGNWNVAFGSGTPEATYEQYNGTSQINIKPMSCYNSAVGNATCGMSFMSGSNLTGCFLAIVTANMGPIQINCPDSLVFEQ